ncbi:hypothetical protein [Micromonospora sp. WMMC415]|uniref:hypothetical protein n=1 Tax=Micromonospora sp. WMMC415 TaxID=2675222 RepID=UPI001E3535AF|nr:hypothetical protein [Micromonospora sp. WMMC415]
MSVAEPGHPAGSATEAPEHEFSAAVKIELIVGSATRGEVALPQERTGTSKMRRRRPRPGTWFSAQTGRREPAAVCPSLRMVIDACNPPGHRWSTVTDAEHFPSVPGPLPPSSPKTTSKQLKKASGLSERCQME